MPTFEWILSPNAPAHSFASDWLRENWPSGKLASLNLMIAKLLAA